MTETTLVPAAPRRALSPTQQLILQCLVHHRLMTTRQVHQAVSQLTADYRWVQRRLEDLRAQGLVDRVRVTGNPRLLAHFATELGAQLVERSGTVPVRPYSITRELAAGPLQEHTLAVNDVGIAFSSHAARLAAQGYECGPLDWTPEVAHRLTDRPAGPMLIADAVVRCVVPRPDGTRILARTFVELDRATMSVERLAEKITAYGRYHQYRPAAANPGRTVAASRPAWQSLYPAWPKILFVLGQAPGRPVSLTARLYDLAMLVQRARVPDGVTAYACLLDDLLSAGPYARIHTALLTGETQTTLFDANRQTSEPG